MSYIEGFNRYTMSGLPNKIASDEQIHFINPDKGELFSYSNKTRIESEVENLLNYYRKKRREHKNSMR